MFDKFGEFDSVEELNTKALEKRNEGNKEELLILCEENGIDKEEAEDFMDGCMEELVNPLMAALGKLKVECEDLKIAGVLNDWVDELKSMCMESEEFARAVRKKGKGLDGYIALTADKGFENRAIVDKRIVKKTKKVKSIIGDHEFSIGIPDKTERKKLAKEYYLGK